MNYEKFLPEKLMPYGAPAMLREGWKQQLKAFGITFGVSLFLGLSALLVGGERNEIYPNKDFEDVSISSVTEMVKVKLEEVLPSISSGSANGDGLSEPELIPSHPVSVTPMPEFTIDLPVDKFDDQIEEYEKIINETFVVNNSSQKSTNGLGNPGNGKGKGDKQGSGAGNGEGPGKFDTEGELDPQEFIVYDEDVRIDLKSLRRGIVYPPMAKEAGIEGRVVLRVLIGSDGRIIKKEVIVGNQIFHRAALDAVAQTNFTPAVYNGRPAPAWIQIPISFKLER